MITDGFLVVDKSSAMTSHDVVAIARRALKTRKVGHAGTLDPMATGVLVLGFGNGTRLLQYITDGEKSYEATMILGARTITDDSEGDVVSTATSEQIQAVTEDSIRAELEKMRGVIMQRPSSVSAVKIGGERAYARVRAGEDFELPARKVEISQLDILDMRRNSKIEVDIRVTCGAGTFIRAIARDCGEALGVGGHLSALRRTQVAPFDLSGSVSVEDLKSGHFEPLTVAEVAAKRFPIRMVTEEQAREISFGRSLSPNVGPDITAALKGEEILALLLNAEGKARPIAVFATSS